MKKGMGVILVLLICFFFLGSSSLQKDDDQRHQNDRRKDTFIPLQRPNIFTLNFHELYDQILAKVKATDNKVTDPTIDILYTPEGEIMDVDCSVVALKESTIEHDTMGHYRIRNNHRTDTENQQTMPEAFSAPSSTMTGIDVYMESGGEYDGRRYMDGLNFEKFPKFIEWFANLNLKSVLEKYRVGYPVRYQFLSGPITSEVVKNPDVHVTYLDCSSTDIHEIEKPKSYPGINYLQFTDKDYYAVIPYYLQDGTIKGFNERKLGQIETEKITYIANNVILLIVDKTEEE